MNGSYVIVTVGGCVYLPPCTLNWSVSPWKSHAEGYERRVNRWSVSVIVRAEKQIWGMWPLTWFISSVRIGSMCVCTRTNVTHKFKTILFPNQKHTPVKLNFVCPDLLPHKPLHTVHFLSLYFHIMQTPDYRHIKWAETQCKGPAPTPSVC